MVEKMKLKTYTARCERVGDWWAISVPELKGVNTQARRLEKVDAMVRDTIALFFYFPTAKVTAKPADDCGRWRAIMDS